ncbi:MAG: carboxypeptidase-like regulatory domain-containing protein, partial [Flavobacteriales bacterium]|nr:carboxypeptidase-like regulatory domain-containing protein [Flavobacteriales bacterium]
YQFTGGKIWGEVPFPLLEIHPGNETWSFNPLAFNMMNIGEFISDRYISFKTEHHFEGLFLNKFPLLKRLQIREIAGLKGVYGDLSLNKHVNIFSLPNFSSSLKKKPYLETYFGLENIFKFIRLDFIWRLSYIDNTFDGIKVSPFGLRGSLQFDF